MCELGVRLMMQDQRLIDRLTRYWNSMRREEPMPRFAQFNSSAIDDIWQQCLLFTVQPASAGKPPHLNFHTIGDQLSSIYGKTLLGTTFNPAQKHFQGATVMSKVGQIIASPAPLVDIGQFVCQSGKTVKYRSCLLPFGGQGVVTHIIAGLSWREF